MENLKVLSRMNIEKIVCLTASRRWKKKKKNQKKIIMKRETDAGWW